MIKRIRDRLLLWIKPHLDRLGDRRVKRELGWHTGWQRVRR